MENKKNILVYIFKVCIYLILCFLFYNSSVFVSFYSEYFYQPFQKIRSYLWCWFPFSLGDIFYITYGIGILLMLLSLFYYIIKFKSSKKKIVFTIYSLVNVTVGILLFFLLGWGGNYFKKPLPLEWSLKLPVNRHDDSVNLVAFNYFLLNNLNKDALLYQSLTFPQINQLAGGFYTQFTNCNQNKYGLKVKPSIFSNVMEQLGIEGYYNPFTGEGQINDHLPSFLLPFVMCHEMAHQASIASEGDANLLAYSLCTISGNPTFRYSAYLNVWMYANHRLERKNKDLAEQLASQLNALTQKHLDTLDELDKKTDNDAARYSTYIYDGYLKMNHQNQGIKSYSNVSQTAWALEQKRLITDFKTIKIP